MLKKKFQLHVSTLCDNGAVNMDHNWTVRPVPKSSTVKKGVPSQSRIARHFIYYVQTCGSRLLGTWHGLSVPVSAAVAMYQKGGVMRRNKQVEQYKHLTMFTWFFQWKVNLPRSLAIEIEHLWKKVKVPRWSRRSRVDGQLGDWGTAEGRLECVI